MIWVTGVDKGCTFVNKGWLSFTGRSLEQDLGNGWAAGIHPDDLDDCFNAYTAAFDARRVFQIEHRLRRSDGEYRWMLCCGVPRFGPGGEFTGYIGTDNDITDLKRSRDEDVARQKLETVGKLASGIAHDFNNLLGGVLAQADLAVARLASGSFAEEQLQTIRGIAIRGAGIVRQLMIYAGQESTGREAVDVSRLIEEMLDLLKVMISKHALLKTDLTASLPAVSANPAQLWQLVINLVTNASEAIGDHDGIIVIRTAQSAADPNPQQCSPGECVELEISDSGRGISREDQPRIFDPTFTTKSAGHGLGLPVVHRIVQELGGRIDFESEPDRGTTFRILLPSAAGMAPSASPAGVSALTDNMNGDATVLVVEDEEALRLPVTAILRKKGLQVLDASDGTEALTQIRAHKDSVAVVLLDITLPGATSREVLTEVRRLRPEVKVIVTSAYGPTKADSVFAGLEIDSFLRKPYRLADLVDLVGRFLPAEEERVEVAPAKP
jgi:PAS domain S-box-containing protein